MQGIDSAKGTEVDFLTAIVGHKIDGVHSKESSPMTNDVSEMIAKS